MNRYHLEGKGEGTICPSWRATISRRADNRLPSANPSKADIQRLNGYIKKPIDELMACEEDVSYYELRSLLVTRYVRNPTSHSLEVKEK